MGGSTGIRMMAWLWSEGAETLDDEMGGKQSSRCSGEATELCFSRCEV